MRARGVGTRARGVRMRERAQSSISPTPNSEPCPCREAGLDHRSDAAPSWQRWPRRLTPRPVVIVKRRQSSFTERAQTPIHRTILMAMPTYIAMIEPLLRYLAANPGGVATPAAQGFIAQHFKLTEDEQSALLPNSNQPVFKNRLGWAHDRLKRATCSTSVKRGFWRATQRASISRRPTPCSPPRHSKKSGRCLDQHR